MPKRRDKPEENKIATERIEKLLAMAKEAAHNYDLDLANSYVKNAWSIKLRFRIRLPLELRRMFCRKCLTFFVEGKTCRIRTKDQNLLITCLNCGHLKRVPLRQKRPLDPR